MENIVFYFISESQTSIFGTLLSMTLSKKHTFSEIYLFHVVKYKNIYLFADKIMIF